MNEQIKAFMNHVSIKIRLAEADMDGIWFDVQEGPLSWSVNDPQDKRRIMFDGRPLEEHKFPVREAHWQGAVKLAEKALALTKERMDGIGNE